MDEDFLCGYIISPYDMGTDHKYALYFIYTAIYFSSFIANTIMMIGLWKTNRRFTRPQTLYFCLCISDILIGTMNFPISTSFIIDSSIYTCELIAIEKFLTIFPISLSMLMMLSIVIDRYLIITKPLFYNKHIADQRIVIIISANIVIAFVLSVTAATISHSSYKQVGVSRIATGLYIVLTMTVMMTLNYILIKHIRKVSKNTGIQGNYKHKVTMSVIILSIVMVICYLPTAVGNLISGIYTYQQDSNLALAYYSAWTYPFLFLNTTINSIVYVNRNTAIKNYVITTVRRPKLQTNITMNTVSTIITNPHYNDENTQSTDQL